METVRWGQGPVDFELESNDQLVLRHARGVFKPWPASESRRVACRWRILARDGMFYVTTRSSDAAESSPQTVPNVEAAVCNVEFAAIARLLDCEERVLCIHSALLSRNGQGVAIVGPSLAGKTTLACALWQKGWSFHCDDAIMIENGLAYPTPRRVSLRTGSRELVGDSLLDRSMATPSFATTSKGCLFHPHEIGELDATPGSASLAAVIFLARRGAPVSGPPRKLPAVETAIGLLPYTNLRKHLPFSDALNHVARVAESVPGYDVPRADLAEMTSAIEDLNPAFGER